MWTVSFISNWSSTKGPQSFLQTVFKGSTATGEVDDEQLPWCEFVHSATTHVADEKCGDFNW